MWFKYGLKAQKLLAQGIALGCLGRCPGLRASALSGRAAYMNFCPLPLLYPSASDFQFRYAPVTVGSGRATSGTFGPSARTSGQLKSSNHNLNHLSYKIIEVLPCINLVLRV